MYAVARKNCKLNGLSLQQQLNILLKVLFHSTLRLPFSGTRGSGMVPFERGLMTSYRHSIVTFPLYLPVSEILAFLGASAPIFSHPTSSLPKISPCSPVIWRLGSKERRCWTNCPCTLFPRFLTYVITIHQRHGRTDGQKDRRTDDMRSQYRTMHIVHRAVKNCNHFI